MTTRLTADLTATIWQLPLPDGASVQAGDTVALLESMKMEIPVEAPVAGELRLHVREGDSVEAGDLIAEIV